MEAHYHFRKQLYFSLSGFILIISFGTLLVGAPLLYPDKLSINEIDTKKGTEGFDEYKESLLESTKQLSILNPEFNVLEQALEKGEKVSQPAARQLVEFSNKAIESSAALQQLAQSQKDVDAAISQLTSSLAQAPFASLVTALEKDYELKLKAVVNMDVEDFQREIDAIDKDIAKFQRGTGTKSFSSKRGRKTRRARTKEDEDEIKRLQDV